MNLRALANASTVTINPNIPITIRRSNGYTIGAGRKQIPSYAADVTGYGQLQALDGDDLKQLEGLNIQGVVKALYITGQLSAVIRPESVGGDLILIDGKQWLVVKVIEGWADWVKVAIWLQEPA